MQTIGITLYGELMQWALLGRGSCDQDSPSHGEDSRDNYGEDIIRRANKAEPSKGHQPYSMLDSLSQQAMLIPTRSLVVLIRLWAYAMLDSLRLLAMPLGCKLCLTQLLLEHDLWTEHNNNNQVFIPLTGVDCMNPLIIWILLHHQTHSLTISSSICI